jgi:protein tyrosine kinase modulator
MTMLQKVDFEDDFQPLQEDRSHLLRPTFYWELLKRRWAYFLIPFVLISCAGVAVAWLWPATYLSEGKILVQSQQIPTELVRPTVTSAAQERIQMIQQRTMTRDNLIAIVDKFQLFPDKRSLMSATELVELMKKNTKIAPVDVELDFKQRTRDNPTIVFSVGFEYGDGLTASRVANELMTQILSEDLRDRTTRATDTTKFLGREVQKLQADNAALDAKIAQLKLSQGKPDAPGAPDKSTTALAELKAELVQKSGLYSERHPIVQSLKRQVEALEKSISSSANPPAAVNQGSVPPANLDALVAQQEALQKNLDEASTKLASARLGENLEKDQQSEKLEVIEQPTVPQEPIKPKRPKLAALAVLLAFAGGAGLTLLAELSDKGIRRASDIFSVVDSQLIISIPYIVTNAELQRHKRRRILFIVGLLFVLAGALAGAYLFLPPLDLMLAKARVGLFR